MLRQSSSSFSSGLPSTSSKRTRHILPPVALQKQTPLDTQSQQKFNDLCQNYLNKLNTNLERDHFIQCYVDFITKYSYSYKQATNYPNIINCLSDIKECEPLTFNNDAIFMPGIHFISSRQSDYFENINLLINSRLISPNLMKYLQRTYYENGLTDLFNYIKVASTLVNPKFNHTTSFSISLPDSKQCDMDKCAFIAYLIEISADRYIFMIAAKINGFQLPLQAVGAQQIPFSQPPVVQLNYDFRINHFTAELYNTFLSFPSDSNMPHVFTRNQLVKTSDFVFNLTEDYLGRLIEPIDPDSAYTDFNSLKNVTPLSSPTVSRSSFVASGSPFGFGQVPGYLMPRSSSLGTRSAASSPRIERGRGMARSPSSGTGRDMLLGSGRSRGTYSGPNSPVVRSLFLGGSHTAPPSPGIFSRSYSASSAASPLPTPPATPQLQQPFRSNPLSSSGSWNNNSYHNRFISPQQTIFAGQLEDSIKSQLQRMCVSSYPNYHDPKFLDFHALLAVDSFIKNYSLTRHQPQLITNYLGSPQFKEGTVEKDFDRNPDLYVAGKLCSPRSGFDQYKKDLDFYCGNLSNYLQRHFFQGGLFDAFNQAAMVGLGFAPNRHEAKNLFCNPPDLNYTKADPTALAAFLFPMSLDRFILIGTSKFRNLLFVGDEIIEVPLVNASRLPEPGVMQINFDIFAPTQNPQNVRINNCFLSFPVDSFVPKVTHENHDEVYHLLASTENINFPELVSKFGIINFSSMAIPTILGNLQHNIKAGEKMY